MIQLRRQAPSTSYPCILSYILKRSRRYPAGYDLPGPAPPAQVTSDPAGVRRPVAGRLHAERRLRATSLAGTLHAHTAAGA